VIEVIWIWPILLVAVGAAYRLLARREDRRRAASWVALAVSLVALAGFAGALLSMAQLSVDQRVQEWPLANWSLFPGAPLSLSLRYDALSALFGLVIALILAAAQVGATNRVDGDEGRLLVVGGATLAVLLAGDLASLLILSAALSCLAWATFRAEARGKAAILTACLVEAALILALVSAVMLTQDGCLFAAVERLITLEISFERPTAWVIDGILLLVALARLGHGATILACSRQDEKEAATSALWLGAILVANALYLLSRAQGALSQAPILLLTLRYVSAATMALGAAALLISPRMGQAIASLAVSGSGAILAATALGAPDLAVYQSVLLALSISGWAAWAAWARHYGADPWAQSELARADAPLTVAFGVLSLVMWATPPLGGYFGQGRVLIETADREHWGLVAAGLASALIIAFYCGRLFMEALLPRIGSGESRAMGRAPVRLMLPALALSIITALGGVWAGAAQRWLAPWLLANNLAALSRLPQPTAWLWFGFYGSVIGALLLAGWVDHRSANKWEHDRIFMERPRSLHEYLAGVAWLVEPHAPRRPQFWPGAAIAALALVAWLYYLMVR